MRMFCIFCFGTVSDGELYVRARVIIIPIIITKSHDILILLKFFWKSYTSEHTQTMIRGIYREILNAVKTGLIYQKHKRLFSNAP